MTDLTVEKVKKFRADRLPGYGAIEVPKTVACIDFLLAKLATIERDTAAECALIARTQRERFKEKAGCYNEEAHGAEWVSESIIKRFNLGETPS